MNEFLSMGGYAAYVWSAFGITLVVLIGNIWSAYNYHERMRLEIKIKERGEETSSKKPRVRQIK